MTATVEATEAYTSADYVMVATPTNYDSDKNFFVTSSVETAIDAVRAENPEARVDIKSTIPASCSASLREQRGDNRIFFRPSFCARGCGKEVRLASGRGCRPC